MLAELGAAFATLAQSLRRTTVRVHDEGGRGSGSGVVWDTRGIVVTNAHVVRTGAATIELPSGRRVRAEVLRRDAVRDLAALKMPAELTPAAATVRDSASLAAGELVVAVGNPLGLSGALTAGVVQRCNERFVIADVKLEPGSSGGALADSTGRVVGINSMVAGGLALAVPTEAVAAFLGTAAAPRRLGIRVVPSAVFVAGRRASARVPALLLTGIDVGSVAQRGGLSLGDAIVAINGIGVRDIAHVAATVGSATALEIVRAGKTLTMTLPANDEDSRAA